MQPLPYSVYILYSESVDRYYVGHTDNIERRMKEHNSGQTRFTSRAGAPWLLKYSETFATRSEAMRREKEIKNKKKRSYIETLISNSTTHSVG